MLSPLELKRTFLEALEIRPGPVRDPSVQITEDYKVQLTTEVMQKPDSRDYRVTVDFRLSPKKDAVCRFDRLEIRLAGYFSLPADTEEELVTRLIPLNCFVILYGIARGIVAQATGMVAKGSFMLPAVNFIEYYGKQKRKEARQAKASQVEIQESPLMQS